MDNFLKYLSFDGRANRQRYWLTSLAIFGLIILGVVIIGLLSAAFRPLAILALPMLIAVVWASLAVGARRLHDRNKSAWWLLVFQGVPAVFSGLGDAMRLTPGDAGAGVGALMALIGFGFSVWAFVELGCLRGTAGPNRFGDDPLGVGVQEVFA
jgi:uncharacterized membrane protein YhaH (DUF805 family)